jgi:RHS repeat-associated protein
MKRKKEYSRTKNYLFLVLGLCTVFSPVIYCGGGGSGKKKGTPPWLLTPSGVNNNTASVSNGTNNPYSQIPTPHSPTTGMYFYHYDHLGNVIMMTDGHGNVVSGGSSGGKSNIVYKPYGEIDREKSTGPDITRYKYTGQEEDKETGLYYYKARYYDPTIGRFLQADSLVDTQRNFGMNRYVYADGNPIRWVDSDGNEPEEGRMKKSITNLITFYFFLKPQKKMKDFHSPGYNYAGDGNTDRLSGFYTSNEKNRNNTYLESTLFLLALQKDLDPQEAFLYTYIFAKYIGPELRPKPVSYMDWVSQKHDDEAPNPLNHFGGKRDAQLQTRASFNFVLRAEAGFHTGKIRTPQDLAVYYIGTHAYLNYGILRGIEHLGQKAGEEIGKLQFSCKNCNVFGR